MSKIPALVSNQDIMILLQEIKQELKFLRERDIENNVTELSLYKASKYLHRNPQVLKDEADEGNLKAIITENEDGKKTYRFRQCDLYEYQKNRVQFSKEQRIRTKISGNCEIQIPCSDWAKKFTEDWHKNNKRAAL